jgi:hypothetical protein
MNLSSLTLLPILVLFVFSSSIIRQIEADVTTTLPTGETYTTKSPEEPVIPLGVEIIELRNPWDLVYLENVPARFDVRVTNPSDRAVNTDIEIDLWDLSLERSYLYNQTSFDGRAPNRSDTKNFIIPAGEVRSHTFGTEVLRPGVWRLEVFVGETFDRVEVEGSTSTSYSASGGSELRFAVHTEEYRNNLVIAIGTILGSLATAGAVIAQVRYSRQQNRIANDALNHERQMRWTEAYERHSQQIAEELEKNWSARNKSFSNSNRLFSNILIQNGRYNHREGQEPYSTYANVTRTHLMNGYPGTWELYEKARDESIQLCSELIEDIKSINKNLSSLIESRFANIARIESWDSNMERFYAVEQLSASLITEFRKRSQSRFPDRSSLQNVRTGIRMADGNQKTVDVVHLRLNTIDVARGSDDDMHRLKQIIDDIIVGPPAELKALIDEYLSIEDKLDNSSKQKEFQEQIDAIITDVNSQLAIQGERSCHICKGLHKQIFGKNE